MTATSSVDTPERNIFLLGLFSQGDSIARGVLGDSIARRGLETHVVLNDVAIGGRSEKSRRPTKRQIW